MSAGIDGATNTATWLIQAIDPNTGALVEGAFTGLLGTAGNGRVSYQIQAKQGLTTGTEISTQARVFFNNAAPVDTQIITNTIDAVAPTSQVTAAPLVAGSSDYLVKWTVADDPSGAGVKGTSVYVSDNGGEFKVWQSQTTASEGVFKGIAGHSYEFLSIALDNAGNIENQQLKLRDLSSRLNTNGDVTVTGGGTPPVVADLPTNSLFTQALQAIPARVGNNPSGFQSVVKPFVASTLVKDLPISYGEVGGLAVLPVADGKVLVSGGTNRSDLYLVDKLGNKQLLANLSTPIFDLAQDKNGTIWASTGGNQLLQLDPTTGKTIGTYGTDLTQALAINPTTGKIYISSGDGIEIFDPGTQTFKHFSNRRVDSLAFNPDGSLWATSWPERGEILKFSATGIPEVVLRTDKPLDSLAFGKLGSKLSNLLFVSSNNGELFAIDLKTNAIVKIASGGLRGEHLATTEDGKIYLAQGSHLDVLNPLLPPKVITTNPPNDGTVNLPNGQITIAFDSDMFVGTGANSALDPKNYNLVGTNSGKIQIVGITYDPQSRIATLNIGTIKSDVYQLTLASNLQNVEGETLGAYQTKFTALTDLSTSIDLNFSNARFDRQLNTIAYDVTIHNHTDADLTLPAYLLLTPELGVTGKPVDGTAQNGNYLVDLSSSLTNGILKAGATIASRTIVINDPDKVRADFGTSIYALALPNQSPVVNSTPITSAKVGQLYRYQVNATDADSAPGSALGYLLLSAPTGMVIDSNSGLITWTPTASNNVKSAIILRVYDSRGGYTDAKFTIDVAGGNNTPTFVNQPKQVNGREGTKLELKINAQDLDRNSLEYWANNLPGGAVFNPTTRTLTWTPDAQSAGTYDLDFYISDGVDTVKQTITLNIAPTNQAPTLAPVTDRTIREGETLKFQLNGQDLDGDKLVYSCNLLPAGATLDPDTGVFTWTPTYFQAGAFTVPFSVSDGKTTKSVDVKFTVLNANAAPVFDPIDRWEIQAGQTVRFQAFALDPDNPGFIAQERGQNGQLTALEGTRPSVTYTASNLPAGATFDADTGIFSWNTNLNSAGTYSVTFTATDDGNGTGTNKSSVLTVPIVILPTDRLPVITAISNQSFQRGDIIDIPVVATDANGDPLVLSATGTTGYTLPDFVTFTDNGNGTGTFHVKPNIDTNSGDYTIYLTATENRIVPLGAENSTTTNFLLTVNAPNDRPQFSYQGDIVAIPGTEIAIPIYVVDKNQDALTYSISGLPTGATIAPTNIYGKAILTWTPTAMDLGNYPVTITVTDSGNPSPNNLNPTPLSNTQTFNLVVRNTNAAPVLGIIGNRSIAEESKLSFQLTGTDLDADKLTYTATNLPIGAKLDPKTGLFTWTPTAGQAGDYSVKFTTSDGNKSSSETVNLTVTHTNHNPILTPLPLQRGSENKQLTFNLIGNDIDGDALLFTIDSVKRDGVSTSIPQGIYLDQNTGKFVRTPNYNQAGEYTFKFATIDAYGGRDSKEIKVLIDNVDRAPTLNISDRGTTIGKEVKFTIDAKDPDLNTVLTYATNDLPLGATLNATTGEFKWTPTAGQLGSYFINFSVSDGELTVNKTATIKVLNQIEPPKLILDLTPSFPVLPGQKAIVSILADSIADIADIQVKVDGTIVNGFKYNASRNGGSFTFTSNSTGRHELEIIATDADGRVSKIDRVIKVKEPTDTAAPFVELASGLNGAKLTSTTQITGRVVDTNLDEWKLEIGELGTESYRVIEGGYNALSGLSNLSILDPQTLANGFYNVRLTATDISGRSSVSNAIVEVNTASKSGYQNTTTDLSLTLGGVPVNLTRHYDASTGKWTFNYDPHIQVNVGVGGGVSGVGTQPLAVGTRLYLTTPTGERVGFTFAPVKQTIAGGTYYTPSWVADAGVNYTLSSADTKLMLAGGKFYDLETAIPYNPSIPLPLSPFPFPPSSPTPYTLTALDGTKYELDAQRGLVGQIAANGTKLIYSDSGIVAATGEAIVLVKDSAGNVTQVTAPNGTQLTYEYNPQGDLVSVRNSATGKVESLGYDAAGRLSAIVNNLDNTGIILDYSNPLSPLPLPPSPYLGGIANFNARSITTTTATRQIYSFNLKASELNTATNNTVLIGVEGAGTVRINGIDPVYVQGNYRVFALDKAGINLLEITNPGATFKLSLVGDLNLDNRVDGLDTQLLTNNNVDLNRDGMSDAQDLQLLGGNYGFVGNSAPVITPVAQLTHVDLTTRIDLSKLAVDKEGDAIAFAVKSASNGRVEISADGKYAIFTPNNGVSGTGSFELIASDGFSSSEAAISVDISNAALVNLSITNRNPKLTVGERYQLEFSGDFVDQKGVSLTTDYLTYGIINSSQPSVITVDRQGLITAVGDGTGVITASRNGISAFTATRVGTFDPQNELELQAFDAEYKGFNLYPQAVTLIPGVSRKIQVGINGKPANPEVLSLGSTGTKYFVSNPNVLTVDENGIITAVSSGVANITVVNGGEDGVIPVLVELPKIGSATLGSQGGAVKALDGAIVTVAPGALNQDTTISIHQIDKNSVAPLDETMYSTLATFSLDLGDKPLNVPVQIAIPAPIDVAVGKEVFFAREIKYLDENSVEKTLWMIEESGRVGIDGMIRTTSFPWPGVTKGAKYTVIVPGFDYDAIQTQINVDNIILATSATALIGIAILSAGVGFGLSDTFSKTLGVGVLTSGFGPYNLGAIGAGGAILGLSYLACTILINRATKPPISIINITPYGLNQVVQNGVRLNFDQLSNNPIPTATIDLPTLPDNTPHISQVKVDLDLDYGRLIKIRGINFGTNINNLHVHFYSHALRGVPGTIVPEKSNLLIGEIAVIPNDLISIGEDTEIVVDFNPEPEPEPETEPVKLPVQLCQDVVLETEKLNDRVVFFDTHTAKDVVNNSANGSADLLSAIVPIKSSRGSYLTGSELGLGHLTVTGSGTRAYAPLQFVGQVAVIDVPGRRQLRPTEDTVGLDGINLPAGARPADIVIGNGDRFAYISDRVQPLVYVLCVDPDSPDYNRLVYTMRVSNLTTNTGIARLALNNDGTRLVAVVSNNMLNAQDSFVVVDVSTAKEDYRIQNYKGQSFSVGTPIAVEHGVNSIAKTPDRNKMVFTNGLEDARGFGVVNLTSGNITYTPLNLGTWKDDFDVNDAVDVTVTEDGAYAFVAARNNRLLAAGIPSVDATPRAGSNVGIIQDPLGSASRLIAATTPIPGGATRGVTLSNQDKYLAANYQVLEATAMFDVDLIRQKLANASAAELEELQSKPIDQVYPDVALANFRPGGWVGGFFDWLQKQTTYDSETFGSKRGVIAIGAGGGAPLGITSTSTRPLLTLNPIAVNDAASLLPTFKWNLLGEQDPDPCEPQTQPQDVEEVELFVSTNPKYQGLYPTDYVNNLANGNPNRILTAKWSGGNWTWNGQSLTGAFDSFKLPDNLMLTAGQDYYWGVKAKIKSQGRSVNVVDNQKFSTPQIKLDANRFSSVTILTSGLERNQFGSQLVNEQLSQIASHITQNDRTDVPNGDRGLILHFERDTGRWYSKNGLSRDYTPVSSYYYGKSLVLDLNLDANQQLFNNTNVSGWAESVADTLFASLVSLDGKLGGSVGGYDSQGNLTRTPGRLFNSSLHFIGVGQGATINDEIVQRLGTYFPTVGGSNTDLQMTTIDAPALLQGTSVPNFGADPEIKVWKNVTFADNYYQTITNGINQNTLIGKQIDGADINVNLSTLYQFGGDDNVGSPHLNTLAWYAGTVNLSGNKLNNQKIYRRLGDLDTSNPSTTRPETWYSPANPGDPAHGVTNVPWEGIETGWFYSALGGGKARRQAATGVRTEVSFDNTVTPYNSAIGKQRGDFAVPTLFNGNFDVTTIIQPVSPVPGWSAYNGANQSTLQNALYQYGGSQGNSNFALRLGNSNNITSVIHNSFLVPDWGDLSLDLYVPNPQGGKLKVSIKGETDTQWQELTMPWGNRNNDFYTAPIITQQLDGITLDTGNYDYSFNSTNSRLVQDPDQSKINTLGNKDKLGNTLSRFETFTLDGTALASLRGKTALLKFEVEGNTTIFLDNIFFQSPHLRLSNPSAARNDLNSSTNYLIERPQYSLSYDSIKKNPNWVSWILDSTWHQPASKNNTNGWTRPKLVDNPTNEFGEIVKPNGIDNARYLVIKNRYPFEVDYALPQAWRSGVADYFNTSINGVTYERGHLSSSDDRNITRKDQFATFLMSNMLPMAEKTNQKGGAWYELERYLSGLAESGKKLYITAGGTDSIGVTTGGVNVPAKIWKVAVILNANQNILDINASTEVIAVILPNDASEIQWAKDGSQDGIGRVSIGRIRSLTGLDLLGNISDPLLKQLLEAKVYPNPYPSGQLRAELDELNQRSLNITIPSSINTSFIGLDAAILHDSILKQSPTLHPETTNSIDQVSIFKDSSHSVTMSDVSPFQVSSSKVSTPQPGVAKIAISQVGTGEVDITQVSTKQNSSRQINSSQIGLFRVVEIDGFSVETDINKISLSSGISSKQVIDTNTNSRGCEHGSSTEPVFTQTEHMDSQASFSRIDGQPIHSNISNLLTNIYSTARSIWHSNTSIDLNFAISNLPSGQLAEATITSYNTNGTPKTATITIDDDANGVGWFIDTTPEDNSEFRRRDGGTGGLGDYFIADSNSEASGKYDLLTAILHEMGHTLGIINGYSELDKYVKGKKFTTNTFTANLTPDGSHLDTTLYPYDLMNTSLKPGVRKLPSALNLAMIDAINAGVGSRESGIGGTVNSANLTAGALLGINNGNFDNSTTWNTVGATNIINGTATLTEQSQKLSELTQAFIIPTGAKTLQFTIKDNHLVTGDTTKTANDAFEVALLDTNTFTPLAGTSQGLTNTDSLLNIQANGTIHKSDKVTITALGNNSSIVTIDLTQVTPTTQATLYFNLLGFGARTSTVTIDDVKLFTDNQPIPVTNNDTLVTNQNTPLTLTTTQLTTNDTNVTQIQIINPPTHGTLTLNPPLPLPGGDFTYTYTPDPTYIGNDSFTYLGFGTDGQISNLATVNLTVNNLPPTIQTVTIPTKINEGQTIQLSATATDGGTSDNLTYTWNLGDGTNPVTGRNIAHTYTDNGNYNVTLTVTDKDGGSTQQTTTVKVDNLAPIVNLTAPNTNLNQGESLNLGVTYSDPGIKDTHTIAWNFDDGSTPITGVTNPNHTFTKAGTNNVTVTVTDNDGASTTKSIQIAVANVAPTITNVNIPTNINEGLSITLTATATDPGNDTLTYNWYINGATTPIIGQTINYAFADNGIYPVKLDVIDSNGAITTKSVDVTVNNVAPTIVNIAKPTTIKEGESVTFSATATDPGILDTLTYSWNFGDNTNPVVGQNVNHTFADNGNYNVVLTVTDKDGGVTTQTVVAKVDNVAPTIVSIAKPTTIKEGESVTFSATATDPGILDTLTYSWNFGDNTNPVIGQNVTHTFADNGSYNVVLTVTDKDGGITTQTVVAKVDNVAPTIVSIAKPSTIKEGESVTFNATATDPGILDTLTYSWNFGDNTTPVTGQNVNHIFVDNGNYNVVLTVTDKDGGVTTQTVIAKVDNVAPTIVSIAKPTTIKEGESVTFSATATDPGILDTLTYSWNFGDSTPVATGKNVNHTFVDNGNYNVVLTVTDKDGAATTQTVVAKVDNVAPTIVSIAKPTTIKEGESVAFSATVTDPGTLDTFTYSWNFGDNTTPITGQNASHIFADNGNYNVVLTVTDKDGGVTTQTVVAKVDNVAPTIVSIAKPTTIKEGESVTFSATATDTGILDTLTYNWNFGDNTTPVNGQNVTHTFADNGNYNVVLTVTDKDGAATTQTVIAKVDNVAPTIVSINKPTQINEGQSVAFSATATDPGTKDTLIYSWNFGDNTTAVFGQNVTHTFADNGNYNVVLTVTDKDGGVTTQTVVAKVDNVAPTIVSIAKPTTIKEGESVTFAATVTDPGILDTLTYSWNFGDNTNTVTGQNVTHTFADNGNYNVVLTVTDKDGGVTTQTVVAKVDNVAPTIVSIAKPTTIKEGESVTFTATATDPGTKDTLTYSWNFGDNTTAVVGQNVTHTFADNGNYNVVLTITDKDGGVTTQTVVAKVDNVAPTIVSIAKPTTIKEGESVAFAATATDPGVLDTLTYSWNFGDNTTAVVGQNVNHTFADNGNYNVVLTVTDKDGGVTTQTVVAKVDNVAPTIVSIIKPTTINQNQAATFTATATDPGSKDTLTYAWNFGDNTQPTTGQTAAHTFTTAGTYTLTLNVTDKDGATTTTTQQITVAPLPTITINDPTITEGDSGTTNLTFTLTLNQASTQAISVSYNTSNITALSGSDYTATSGTITFNAGETTKTITVAIIGDTIAESTETFALNLTNAINATISKAQGTATILDNDPVAITSGIRSGGTVSISGSANLDGNINSRTDDTKIYAAQGVNLNGNITLPVKRDAAGNPLKDAAGKVILETGEITIAPGGSTSSLSSKYSGIASATQTITIPTYTDTRQQDFLSKVPATGVITYDIGLNPINNTATWNTKFPPAGTSTNPTVVRIINGNLNVPANINLSNYIIIVENGNIIFNNGNPVLNNVTLIANSGNIDLKSVAGTSVSLCASGNINFSGGNQLAGNWLVNSNGNTTFAGGNSMTNTTSQVKIVAQGNIEISGNTSLKGQLWTKKNFQASGSTTIVGAITAGDNVEIGGNSTITG